MKEFIRSIRVFIGFSLLCGLIYPLAITFVAQKTMPDKANGSLIQVKGSIIGSSLIAQGFSQPQYFHSRPSANDYDGQNSGGSNLGPSSKKLMDQIVGRVTQNREENRIEGSRPLPADMVLASASGLDPHISIENALIQAHRIAGKRKVDLPEIKALIAKNTDPDFIGIWGAKGVNVLRLNLALDTLAKKG